MYGINTNLTKISLWGLSNLTCVPKYAQTFVNQEECLQRCLFLMSNQNVTLASEAGVVVASAVISLSNDALQNLFWQKDDELVEALVNCLKRIEKNNEYLLIQLLKCFEKLLEMEDSLSFS